MEVCKRESLGNPTLDACKKLVQACKNNLRTAYQKVESGELLAG